MTDLRERVYEAVEPYAREVEDYAREGWAWLDAALNALGVETVFDIPGWREFESPADGESGWREVRDRALALSPTETSRDD